MEQEIIKDLVGQVAEGHDEIIIKAITEKIGRINPVELKGRLIRVSYNNSPQVLWLLDNKPLIEMFPIKIKEEKEQNSVKLVATQPYRVL